MGHPRSDLGCPRTVLVGPGQSQDGLVCLRMVQDRLGMVWVCLGLDQVSPRLTQFHLRPSQAYPRLTWVRPGLVQIVTRMV